MKIDWKDKIVLITGSSQGIGKKLAEEFGLKGSKVNEPLTLIESTSTATSWVRNWTNLIVLL